MDTKKKIIVGVVGLVLSGVLFFFFTSSNASNKDSSEDAVKALQFDSPSLDEEKIKNNTKKELYDSSKKEYESERYDSLTNNLSFLQKMKQKLTPDSLNESEFDEASLEDSYTEEDDINAQLQMLMAMQNQINSTQTQQLQPTANYATPAAPVVPEEVPEIKKIPKEGSFFFGAGSKGKKRMGAKNLIPAEVIDQGIQKQGTTIAIRTKQSILINGITIPKGAVIYGISSIDDTRLMIKINKYKRDNKLYDIDMDVHDYDGQVGIHLENRTIFKIPSNVTKDVYKAAEQRYTQQIGIFGGETSIKGKDLAKIAGLSAAKEISKELLDRRRVFIPRKYHLWLTINEDEDAK